MKRTYDDVSTQVDRFFDVESRVVYSIDSYQEFLTQLISTMEITKI